MTNGKPKKGVTTGSNNHINLKMGPGRVSVVQFRHKRPTVPSKLMKAYCERQFLEMKDEGTIDLFQQQLGSVH
ncbi:small ubiquitin-related modifier 2-like [Saccopteryx leptura]|uniref:small ubiquitin-related modifier 2-like n=1 Tax=Saccopteryx leptura TaxID=249018 RepID=UPI00339C4D14